MTLTLSHLTRKFGDNLIFDDCSHTFTEGQTHILMGPSGSGKTTLLRMIAGLDNGYSGIISGVPEKIAFVFQENRLCEDFSLLSNLRMITGKSVSNEQLLSLLEAFELAPYADKPVRTFSGGMKRRAAIARALSVHADLILMDEPFKGLNRALKEKVMNVVRTVAEGKTVLLVTHDPDEAAFFGGVSLTVSTHFE